MQIYTSAHAQSIRIYNALQLQGVEQGCQKMLISL